LADANASQSDIDAATAVLVAAQAALQQIGTPSEPTALQAEAADKQVTLGWVAPLDDGGAALTSYALEYSLDGGLTWLNAGNTGVALTTTIITGLQNNREYRFRVAANNSNGRGAFSLISDPVVPAAPTPRNDGNLPNPATGEVELSHGGINQPVTLEVINENTLRLSGADFEIGLISLSTDGQPISIASIDAVVRL